MAYSLKKVARVALALSLVSCLYLELVTGARRIFRSRVSASGEEFKKPFVLLYEHENFRGKEYVQYISKECINLPKDYSDWASSVDTHRTCASVCTSENCIGSCRNVYSNQGISKLRVIGFNDKIKSVRSCF